jgi:hypothetical protein
MATQISVFDLAGEGYGDRMKMTVPEASPSLAGRLSGNNPQGGEI